MIRLSTDPLTPEDYIHQILPNVLISNDDDQSSIFELALHLTKMYDHGIDTIRAVLGNKCCTIATVLDVVKAVQAGSYELWRGVCDDVVLGRECINHVNNNVDLDDLDELWDLISSNADPEEVGQEFRLNCGGQYTSYGFLVKIK